MNATKALSCRIRFALIGHASASGQPKVNLSERRGATARSFARVRAKVPPGTENQTMVSDALHETSSLTKAWAHGRSKSSPMHGQASKEYEFNPIPQAFKLLATHARISPACFAKSSSTNAEDGCCLASPEFEGSGLSGMTALGTIPSHLVHVEA